jgi:hypothetical protein
MTFNKTRNRRTDASLDRVQSILMPVALEIATAREATNGIVFVVHRPGKTARAAMVKIGTPLRHKRTTVFGLSCSDATVAFGHDLVTKRWIAIAPLDGQIKVFLIAGDGSALLTLNFEDGEVHVVKEPDVYLARAPSNLGERAQR